jgi:general secretion pathway protein G
METSVTKVKLARSSRRALSRGVTLVEVLIVLSIMALISGAAVFMVFPRYRQAQVKTAKLDGVTIRKATQIHIEIDGNTGSCPTVQDLVAGKKLEAGKTTDPWGKPYKIVCNDDDIRVISSGRDGKEGSQDDVPDNLPDKDVERVAGQ